MSFILTLLHSKQPVNDIFNLFRKSFMQYKRVIWAIIGYRIFIAARRCNAICNVLPYCHKVVIKYISHLFWISCVL